MVCDQVDASVGRTTHRVPGRDARKSGAEVDTDDGLIVFTSKFRHFGTRRVDDSVGAGGGGEG